VDRSRTFQHEDLEKRLISRDAVRPLHGLCVLLLTVRLGQLLVSTHLSFCGQSFLHLLLKQTEAIKFASDWKQRGHEPGGKAYKTTFARSIYLVRTGRQPPTDNASEQDLRDFKTFRTRQQKLVMARNHILKLFLQVCFCQIISCPPMLPTFTVGCSLVRELCWTLSGMPINSPIVQKHIPLSLISCLLFAPPARLELPTPLF
jgi:hypothetical protein